MHVPSHPLPSGRGRRLLAALAPSILAALLASCASPGPPKPPSLHLPEVVTDLSAQRVGPDVHLHWTSPSRTTDKSDVSSPMVAEVCRDPHPQSEPAKSPSKPASSPSKSTSKTSKPTSKPIRSAPLQSIPGCDVVLHVTIKPGVTDADDRLPPALTADPVALLSYRVRILNPQGRSAGFSQAALAPAGAAPPPVAGLKATSARNGAVLEWQPLGSASLVELDRTLPGTPAEKAAPKKKAALALPDEQPTEVRLRSAKDEPPQNDPGGILDHTVLRGQSYVYRAQRIRTVAIAGKKFEIRGAVSSPFTLAMTDSFAPATPTGLAAIPGTQGNVATIDLSWRPRCRSRRGRI